jgi:hypothetical protein
LIVSTNLVLIEVRGESIRHIQIMRKELKYLLPHHAFDIIEVKRLEDLSLNLMLVVTMVAVQIDIVVVLLVDEIDLFMSSMVVAVEGAGAGVGDGAVQRGVDGVHRTYAQHCTAAARAPAPPSNPTFLPRIEASS